MKTKTARKKTNRKVKTAPRRDWQQLCRSLLRERDQTRLELEHLRAENKMLRQNLYMLMDEDYGKPIDKEKLLAQAVFEPSLEDVIAELRREVPGNASRK